METTEKLFPLATARGYANTIQNVPPDFPQGAPVQLTARWFLMVVKTTMGTQHTPPPASEVHL
jgi:hypothetical protein